MVAASREAKLMLRPAAERRNWLHGNVRGECALWCDGLRVGVVHAECQEAAPPPPRMELPGTARAVAWGERRLAAALPRALWVWESAGPPEEWRVEDGRAVLEGCTDVTALEWGPDGQLLAAFERHGVFAGPPDALVRLAAPPDAQVHAATWAPGGLGVLVALAGGGLWRCNAGAEAEKMAQLPAEGPPLRGLVLAGTRLLALAGQSAAQSVQQSVTRAIEVGTPAQAFGLSDALFGVARQREAPADGVLRGLMDIHGTNTPSLRPSLVEEVPPSPLLEVDLESGQVRARLPAEAVPGRPRLLCASADGARVAVCSLVSATAAPRSRREQVQVFGSPEREPLASLAMDEGVLVCGLALHGEDVLLLLSRAAAGESASDTASAAGPAEAGVAFEFVSRGPQAQLLWLERRPLPPRGGAAASDVAAAAATQDAVLRAIDKLEARLGARLDRLESLLETQSSRLSRLEGRQASAADADRLALKTE